LTKERDINLEAVAMDAWYSKFETYLEKNRKVNYNVRLESLEILDERLKIHLCGYGWVIVFKFVAKNGRIDHITTNII